MITGEIKNKIDAIWSTFWESAGITNPMDVLSQMTYLFFMKMLDDAQIKKEATAHAFGGGKISDPTFPDGEYAECVARSDNGEIDGHFIQKEPLFTKDGGHGMLFRTPEGELRLALHSPNTHLAERPRFIPVTL